MAKSNEPMASEDLNHDCLNCRTGFQSFSISQERVPHGITAIISLIILI